MAVGGGAVAAVRTADCHTASYPLPPMLKAVLQSERPGPGAAQLLHCEMPGMTACVSKGAAGELCGVLLPVVKSTHLRSRALAHMRRASLLISHFATSWSRSSKFAPGESPRL